MFLRLLWRSPCGHETAACLDAAVCYRFGHKNRPGHVPVRMEDTAVNLEYSSALKGLDPCRQELRNSFIPLEFSCPDGAEGSFVSSFVTREMGALRLTEAAASSSFPYIGQLRREHIPPNSPDQFVLLITRTGRARHTQFGRSDITTPGKMILLDACAPYQLQPELSLSSLHIMIPGAPLRAAVGVPEEYCGIAIDAAQGLNAMFRDFLHGLWREFDHVNDEQKELLSSECLNLLVASLKTIEGRARVVPLPRRDDEHFERALRFIDANLSDPSLGAAQVARALRLSDSRLHAIARSKGSSIGQTILDRRLERCSRALLDPRCRHRGVTQLAFDWGFKNATHFSRTFKAKFGVSPRDYRKQCGSGSGG